MYLWPAGILGSLLSITIISSFKIVKQFHLSYPLVNTPRLQAWPHWKDSHPPILIGELFFRPPTAGHCRAALLAAYQTWGALSKYMRALPTLKNHPLMGSLKLHPIRSVQCRNKALHHLQRLLLIRWSVTITKNPHSHCAGSLLRGKIQWKNVLPYFSVLQLPYFFVLQLHFLLLT